MINTDVPHDPIHQTVSKDGQWSFVTILNAEVNANGSKRPSVKQHYNVKTLQEELEQVERGSSRGRGKREEKKESTTSSSSCLARFWNSTKQLDFRGGCCFFLSCCFCSLHRMTRWVTKQLALNPNDAHRRRVRLGQAGRGQMWPVKTFQSSPPNLKILN